MLLCRSWWHAENVHEVERQQEPMPVSLPHVADCGREGSQLSAEGGGMMLPLSIATVCIILFICGKCYDEVE